ncbi:hypothetical protein ACET3Z_028071 [Daucus carota]
MSSSTDPIVESFQKCFCGGRVRMKTSWTEKNPGRRFISCPRRKVDGQGCKFFEWIDPELNVGVRELIADLKHNKSIMDERLKFIEDQLIKKSMKGQEIEE